jgi:hypothetical protein
MRFKNLNELPAACKKNNPQLFGAVGPVAKPVVKPDAVRPLARLRPVQKGGAPGFVVSLVRFGPGLLDDDNLAGGFKPLRDAVAQRLGIDDADGRVRWEYGQVETRGPTGTIVKIQTL